MKNPVLKKISKLFFWIKEKHQQLEIQSDRSCYCFVKQLLDETRKLILLQSRAIQAQQDIANQRLIDGDEFFESLELGEKD